uniref:Uncharacterized protein n=1 Tax=Anopheles maculatus TaxID=74869 RepID=A0A182T212_9DIPT
MLSRAVNVFRKKKSRKSIVNDDGDDHGTDTNASETETEPDDCSCRSEPMLLGSVTVSTTTRLQDSSPASSTEYFQDGPEHAKETSWITRRKKHLRKDETETNDDVEERSSSITSSLLSTIRRARSRSRSRSISTSAAAGRSTPKLLPTSKSTLSSHDGGYGGVASSAHILHGDEKHIAPNVVVVSSASFAWDTKKQRCVDARKSSEDRLRSPTLSTGNGGVGGGSVERQGDGKRQGLMISCAHFVE